MPQTPIQRTTRSNSTRSGSTLPGLNSSENNSPSIRKENKELLNEVKNMLEDVKHQMIQALSQEIQTLKETIQHLTCRVKEVEKQNEVLTSRLHEANDKIADIAIEEYVQRKKRETNVVIFGLVEKSN